MEGPLPSSGQPPPAQGGGVRTSDSDTIPVTFMSYNMTGADTIKCQWVRDMASEHDVDFCTLQEHFKTVKSTDQWFKKQFSKHHTYVIPAYRLPGVDTGRGIGGLVQLARRDLAVSRARVVTQSLRVQAQILKFQTCKVLWINVYMPCDPQLQHCDDTELVQTLSEIERIVTSSNSCEVILSGDMNYNNRRDNHFTRTVASTLQRLHLTSVWEGRDIDYTHVHTDNVKSSILDHFLVSPNLLELVEDCGPVHNLSRHSAIFLSLRLGDLARRPEATQPPPPCMPAWDRSNSEEILTYTSTLHQKLKTVKCPGSMLHCRDPMCEDSSHSESRDVVVLDILLAMVETSYVCLPLTGRAGQGGLKDRKVIPGWSREVEPYRRQSNYSFRAWLAAGKPSHGDLHQAKVKSHAVFRHAVRRVKRASQLYQAKGLLEAARDGDMALMKEMRRVQSGKGALDELPDTVDGVTGLQDVANQFGDVHNALYNSAESKEELTELQNRIQGLVQSEDSNKETRRLSAEVVKKAAMRLKPHKMDVSQGFSSDCLLHAPDLMFQLLSLVFQDWLTHGTVTRSILSCAFIPLLKSNKDPGRNDSYRAIASSSLILKLFEYCVLLVWGDKLQSDTIQFGFKRGCGTSSATWLVLEVLQHFLRAGTKPIAVI